MSARDQQKKDGQWTRAKGHDTFCPVGPWIVTDVDPADLDMRTEVNGEIKQHSRTSLMIHDIGAIVEWVSAVMTLLPGDLILTGTPEGVGPIEDGDTVSITIEGIGTFTNPVVRKGLKREIRRAPKTDEVRVRFCPSPTGTPHVGLIRTALFNWAYARHTGGAFVFRLEDTDAERDSEESYLALLDALSWLGLDYDEGPDIGGPYAPYRQSERGEIHRDVVRRLLEAGEAYEAFSTPEEVEARHLAAGRNPKLGYDNFDRDLTDEQRAAFVADGRKPVVRLRMPDADIIWHDLVRGETTFAAGTVPDFAMTRASGDPLYTLVNPVDDALMKITHVLRGEDILPSTPRQIALYQALIRHRRGRASARVRPSAKRSR